MQGFSLEGKIAQVFVKQIGLNVGVVVDAKLIQHDFKFIVIL